MTTQGPLWYIVRMDFVLAVLLLVLWPLVLLVMSLRNKQLLAPMLAYWRASALLMITVYLMIAELPVAFLCGVLARVFIPAVLWQGDAFYKGQMDLPTPYLHWRRAATGYCIVGVLITLPLLESVLTSRISDSARLWLQPPQEFGRLFHPNTAPALLGNAALTGLYAYAVYAFISTVLVIRRNLFR